MANPETLLIIGHFPDDGFEFNDYLSVLKYSGKNGNKFYIECMNVSGTSEYIWFDDSSVKEFLNWLIQLHKDVTDMITHQEKDNNWMQTFLPTSTAGIIQGTFDIEMSIEDGGNIGEDGFRAILNDFDEGNPNHGIGLICNTSDKRLIASLRFKSLDNLQKLITLLQNALNG